MKRIYSFSPSEEQFLIERLRKEWVGAERATKRHEIVNQAKVTGKILMRSLLVLGLLGGVVSIAAVAPNIFAAYGTSFREKRYYGRKEFEKQFRYLRAKKYLTSKKTEQGYHLTLTAHGRSIILHNTAKTIRILKKGTWDGTWWIAMFDIPRRHNAARNALRERLKAIGMELLQNSVFISQYPCREEIWFAAKVLSVSSYVKIAHIDSLEGYR